MEIPFDYPTVVNFTALVLGVASGMVILYHAIKRNPVNMPLAVGQLALAVAMWVNFLVISKLIIDWPFFYRLGSLLALVYMPLPFLYVSWYTQLRTWRWYDALHFLPLLVFIVDLWPVLTASNAEKLTLILRDIGDPNRYASMRESRLFPAGFHQNFRTVAISAYWVAQCVLLWRWTKHHSKWTYEDRIWKNWMLVFLIFQAGLWVPFYLTFAWIDKSLTYHMIYTTAATWMVVASLLLLMYPSLLYGQPTAKLGAKVAKDSAQAGSTAFPGDNTKWAEVKRAVDQGLADPAIFLRPGITIHEFAQAIQVPVYQVSKYITLSSGLGFIDAINQRRIAYCVNKLESGEWKHFKLEAIASECGFNNRNSFTNAFKKFQGMSPSEYKRQLVSES